MERVDGLLADYGSYHRTRGNIVCHSFGITLIVFGVLSMLQTTPIAGFSAAEVLIAAAALYYLLLDIPLGLAVTAAIVLLDVAARAVADWRVGAGAFATGWIFQGIGHARYEKNSPAFFRNLVHLLVGPMFLVNELLRIRGPVPQSPAR